MPTHVVYAASFSPDKIEVGRGLPQDRIALGHDDYPIPVHQGYKLLRLRIDAEEEPILPDGDITGEEFEQWLSIFDPDAVIAEEVDDKLRA